MRARTARAAADLRPSQTSGLPLFADRGFASVATEPATYGDDFARAVRVPDYDACEARHGGNARSAAANDRAAPTKQEQRRRVLAAVRAAGTAGLTCKELARAWGTGMNNVSGRFTELRKLGLIAVKKDALGRDIAREDCAVYVEG